VLFAQFVPGPTGRLFVAGHRPEGARPPAHWLLLAPPLAEELNKSRRTLSLLGRALAAAGVGFLMVDLFGTGDSEGDFRAATWQGWVEDIGFARRWLLDQGAERVDLLAVRGGALLAWDYLARADVDRLLFWQPSISGRQLAAQLLRLRVAANIMGRGDGETAGALRRRMQEAGWLEIAGYAFSADLFSALETAEIGPLGGRHIGALDWFQVHAGLEQPFPPPAQHAIDAWRADGLSVATFAVRGDAFWTTQEICEGTALCEATVGRIMQLR
jgi:exosortase A-associated hydrolase 2